VSIVIAAKSNLPPVSGDSYVNYMTGKDATAQIHGEIKDAASGEVAQLYAQPFPYRNAPAQIGAVILHPTGKTAQYAFEVTPSVATRYTVELFQNSTATSPLASSATRTIYVDTVTVSGNGHACSSPVCSYAVYVKVPASALSTEISKHVYLYLGFNNGSTPPKWLLLGAGDSHVTTPHRISATEFSMTITFTFSGNNGAWTQTCVRDTEAKDGIGLPGHHGCGDQRIPYSASYLG
jgi:hypothetical protein